MDRGATLPFICEIPRADVHNIVDENRDHSYGRSRVFILVKKAILDKREQKRHSFMNEETGSDIGRS